MLLLNKPVRLPKPRWNKHNDVAGLRQELSSAPPHKSIGSHKGVSRAFPAAQVFSLPRMNFPDVPEASSYLSCRKQHWPLSCRTAGLRGENQSERYALASDDRGRKR